MLNLELAVSASFASFREPLAPPPRSCWDYRPAVTPMCDMVLGIRTHHVCFEALYLQLGWLTCELRDLPASSPPSQGWLGLWACTGCWRIEFRSLHLCRKPLAEGGQLPGTSPCSFCLSFSHTWAQMPVSTDSNL